MTRSSLLTTTSVAVLSIVTACGGGTNTDPPSSSEVRARISSDLKHILDQSSAAGEGAVANLTAPGFLGRYFDLGGESVSEDTGGGGFFQPPPDGEEPPDGDGDGDGEFDPQAIIDQLNQQLFTDANEVEPGIYAVPASFACGEPDPANPDYPDCANSWSDIALRVRVSENADELRFTVQLGAQHDEPLSVALTQSSLAVSVDLDEAESAMETIATALGEEAPHVDIAGALTASLSVLGEAHVALDVTVDRDVSIAFAEDGVDLASPDAFHFTTEASHALHIELDGTAETGNLVLDVGATTLNVPDSDETFGLDLPGLAANATLSAGELSITGISLGDRTTRVLSNGQTAIAIDLNRDDGRSLDATLSDDGAGGALIAVEPAFDLRLAIDHAVLGDVIEVYDVTRVLLTGALRGSEDSEGIEVASGTFAIETNPAGYGFSASAGECVTAEDVYDDMTFTSYTLWTVAACN